MTCFVNEGLQLQGHKCIRGRGDLEVNAQPCEERQRYINERDIIGYTFNMNKVKANE